MSTTPSAGFDAGHTQQATQRRFARRAVALIAAGATLAAVLAVGSSAGARAEAQAQSAPAGQRPNVLFVVFDDLNDWTGPTKGHPQAHTPTLDALAANGTSFASAHIQAPLCNSSRSSFLSGLRPSTTGIYALQPSLRTALGNDPALRDHVTLPGLFTANGYQTISVGKIYHVLEPEYRDREFQTWIAGARTERPASRIASGDEGGTVVDWGVHPERDEDVGDYQTADLAIEQLKGVSRDRPFFLAVGFSLPHVPLYVPQRWFDRIPADQVALPPIKHGDRADTPPFSWFLHWKLPEPRLAWYEQHGELENFVRAYLASTTFADAQLGRLLAALRETGHDQNTIVVVFGDHGYHLGEQEISGKNTLWERSTRVPLVIAGPGVPHREVADAVEILDLYPTLAELARLPAPAGVFGVSLVPQLRGEPRTRPAITTSNRGNHAVRTKDWRYIRYADGSQELYDHRVDRNEWNNLASDAKYAPVIAELSAWLPKDERAPVPGSRSRLLTQGPRGEWLWEDEPIVPADPTVIR